MTPPAPRRNRWSWRSLHRPPVILALVLPLRIAAVVGLTAMVALIVRERGDVSGLVWLRSGVLAILAWTVATQLRSLTRSHRSRRRGSAVAGSIPRLLLAAVPPHRLVAARKGQPIARVGVRRQRLRGTTAAASWWMLIVAVVGICVVAAVLVVAWMVDDLSSGGAGPWLVGQVLLLTGAAFAIGWTVWMAVRSAADLRSRRRRPLVQRFLNWLVRLLSLNRTSALTAAAPSPGAAATATVGGAGASSTGLAVVREAATAGPLFVHRVVATALVATASMVTGAAALADSSDAGHQPESVVAGAVAEPGGAGPVTIPPAAGSDPDDSGTPAAPAPTTSTTPVVPPTPTTSTTSPPTTTTTTSPSSTTSTVPTPTTSLPLVPPTPSTVPTTTSLPLVPPPPSSTPPTTTTLPQSSTTTTTTASPTTTSTTASPTTTSTTTTSVPASCGPRGNPDTDCDGISDAQEIAYGSDPDNRASRPEGRDWDTLVDGDTCADRLDNDADGRTDDADPGCSG